MESRAHCVGFSVMEIGNRKERLRDYASFPDKSLRQGLGIGITRPQCGIQRDGNRKSQGALARSRSGRVCRRQRTAPLCELPGSAAPNVLPYVSMMIGRIIGLRLIRSNR